MKRNTSGYITNKLDHLFPNVKPKLGNLNTLDVDAARADTPTAVEDLCGTGSSSLSGERKVGMSSDDDVGFALVNWQVNHTC